MVKEFVIATDTSKMSDLELDLYNLKFLLKIQEDLNVKSDVVDKTKKDIEIIEELLESQG